MRFSELTGWSVTAAPDGTPLLVLDVGEDAAPELAAAVGEGDTGAADAPSERFAGAWRAGEKDGRPLISFLLVEEADPGLERAWWTDRFDAALLQAAAATPHRVSVRAGGAAIVTVLVEHPSRRVAELLAAQRAG